MGEETAVRKLLITIATPEIRGVAAPFLENHKQYAIRNNYEYVAHGKRFWEDKHPSFSKTGYLQQALRDDYDLVLYADLDVAFITQGVDLANLLIGTNKWFAAYQQQNWDESPYLNAGLFVVRQCLQAREFADEWVHRCETGCPDWVPGKITPIIDFPWENWHLHGIAKKLKYEGMRCCNAKEIGCFCPDIWHDGVIWNRSHPTIHFSGQMATWQQRADLFTKKYLKLVC